MRTWAPRLGKLEEWKLRQGISQTRDKYRSDMEKNTDEYKRLTRLRKEHFRATDILTTFRSNK